MLNLIGIKNFKSFKNYEELELKNLTLLSGLNSTGKSTVYQAILLLAQSYGKEITDKRNSRLPTLVLNGKLCEFGKYDEILNDLNKKSISFSFGWINGAKVDTTYALLEEESSKCHKHRDVLPTYVISRLRWAVNNETLLDIEKKGEFWNLEAYNILSFSDYKLPQIIEDQLANNNIKMIDFLKPRVFFNNVSSVFIKDLELKAFKVPFNQILNTVQEEYRKYLDLEKIKTEAHKNKIDTEYLVLVKSELHENRNQRICDDEFSLLPPFRGLPKRIYSEKNELVSMVKYKQYENRNIPMGYDYDSRKIIIGNLKEALNFWLSFHFEIAQEIDIHETIPGLISEIFLKIDGVITPINNVGFGTSQLIPVVFNLLTSKRNKLVVVDEPEIHLHPSLQSKLADFFMQMSMAGKRVLIETHSEYIIDRMIYLILKYSIPENVINLLWVKKDQSGSKIEKIIYDDLGFIINSPNGFLSEKTKLVGDLTQIRMKRIENE